MNAQHDKTWQNLLARSTPTFAGSAEPPYGFIAATLAGLRSEKRQQEEMERIGWRALVGSLVTLCLVATLTVGLQLHDRNDLDPAVKRLVEIDHIAVS